MGYDLSNSRRWIVPHGGGPREVLRVTNAAGVILWEKYYRVSYEANCDGMQYWMVYFNANGGSGSMPPLQVPKGSSVALPACAFSRAGYALKAQQYNTAANGSGAPYSAGGSLTPTANMTLYAQWQANSYTISFNPGGGSGSMSPVTAAYRSGVTLPACAFTKTGHAFDIWECTIGGEESYFEDQDWFVMPAQDLSLTAQWIVSEYTVTFNGNFPDAYLTTPLSFSYAVPPPSTKNVGDPVGTLGTVGDAYSGPGGEGHHIIPDNAGLQNIAWKFLGWYTAADGGTEVTGSTAFSGDTTVYAHWERRLYIRFNRQYGATGDERYVYSFFIDAGKTVGQGFASGVLPTITRSGYTLLGWYSAQDPESRKADSTYPKVDSGNKLHYMVKYRDDGGTASSNLRKIYVSSNAADSVSFTEGGVTGNTVKVWDGEMNAEVNMGGVPRTKDFVPASNTILYAHWTANAYTVTWNANGGSSVPAYSRSYGMEIGILPSSTKAGYTLDGWFTVASGGTQVTSGTIVTGNVTYYARWSPDYITITFDSNGGS